MPLSFPESAQLAQFVGRSPWTAADALVGSLGFDEAYFVTQERVQGDPRRPGGLPHHCIRIPSFRTTKWHWDAILRWVANPRFAPIANRRVTNLPHGLTDNNHMRKFSGPELNDALKVQKLDPIKKLSKEEYDKRP